MAHVSDESVAALIPCLRYAALMEAASRLGAPSLHGRLLLAWTCDADLAAARVAGAATLLLADSARARREVRSSAADFAVTSLDEALRILKNETRRRAPVGVCLAGEIEGVLGECVARGVQPDLVDGTNPTLIERGAQPFSWTAQSLGPGVSLVSWSLLHDGPLPLLEEVSLLARESLHPASDRWLRWLEHAPRAYGRRMHRWRALPMLPVERERFLRRLENDSSDLSKSLLVEENGAPLWPLSRQGG